MEPSSKREFTLPAPEKALTALWAKIPMYLKVAFFSALSLGLVTHLYMLTNKWFNHDDARALFSFTYGTASGRWLLPLISRLDGDYSMPWLIGMLSLLCLAVAVCITVELLRIRHTAGCIVTAGLMVSFPTVAATLTYTFTAFPYFLCLVMAALSALLVVRFPKWWGVILSAIMLTLAMGIYQSYFTVAAVLMVGALIFETLDGTCSFGQLVKLGIQRVIALFGGMAVYMVIVRLTTRNIGLTDYMGLSTMGSVSIQKLPRLIVRCYREYFNYFWMNSSNHQAGPVRYFLLLAGICTVLLLALLLHRKKLGVARTVLVVVLVILYPLAGNIIHVMVAGADVHQLMVYGMVYLLVAPVALSDYVCTADLALPVPEKNIRSATAWMILFALAVTSYSYMITSNKAYFKMQMVYEQTYSYSTRLISAVESCNGYQRGISVVMVGSSVKESELYPTPALDEVQMTGVLDMVSLRTSVGYGLNTYSTFLQNFLGYTDPVYLDGSDLCNSYAEMPEVQAMPIYPEAGSIRNIDGVMVVHLGDLE